MNGILIDSCVLLDLFTDDPIRAGWSEDARIEEVEEAISRCSTVNVIEIPREALFLAGKVFLRYKNNRGTIMSTLPDFFIGAHASISNFSLMTRDTARYRTYFPSLKLIHP